MNNVKTGNLIKQLRKEKGLTQKDLAEQLGITDKAISKWERGLSSPDIALLEELSQILDITVLELIKGKRLKKEITNKDIIETIKYSRKSALKDIKKIYKAFSCVIIGLIIIFIIITNIKSIMLEHTTINAIHDYHQISKEKVKDLINETNANIETILSNQGIYTNDEYNTITRNIKPIKEYLSHQNNEFYLEKKTYSFNEIMNFYQDHTDIAVGFINYKEIYEVLLKYDTTLNNNLISYNHNDTNIITEYYNLYTYQEQPYQYLDRLPYKGYQPNPLFILEMLYENYNRLLKDIIKVGELKWKVKTSLKQYY